MIIRNFSCRGFKRQLSLVWSGASVASFTNNRETLLIDFIGRYAVSTIANKYDKSFIYMKYLNSIYSLQVWACPEEYPPPSHIKNRLDMSLPSEGNMADYFYVFKQKGAWKSWADFVRRFEPDISHLGIQVATVDTARYSHLLELHVKVRTHTKTFNF